jgi:hypothetical protein
MVQWQPMKRMVQWQPVKRNNPPSMPMPTNNNPFATSTDGMISQEKEQGRCQHGKTFMIH